MPTPAKGKLDKMDSVTRSKCTVLYYLDWKNLIQLKIDKVHSSPEGLKKMQDIKASMNKGRS